MCAILFSRLIERCKLRDSGDDEVRKDFEAIEQIQLNLEQTGSSTLLYGESESLISNMHRNLTTLVKQAENGSSRS